MVAPFIGAAASSGGAAASSIGASGAGAGIESGVGGLGQFAQGAGGDLAGGLLTNYFAKKAASKQRKWDWAVERSKYRTAAIDLEKAGLNRILAIASPGSAPAAPTPNLARFDPVGKGVLAATAKQQIEQMKAMTAAELARTRLINEQTVSQAIDNTKKDVTTPIYEALTDPIKDAVSTASNAVKSTAKQAKSHGGKPVDYARALTHTSGLAGYISSRQAKRRHIMAAINDDPNFRNASEKEKQRELMKRWNSYEK